MTARDDRIQRFLDAGLSPSQALRLTRAIERIESASCRVQATAGVRRLNKPERRSSR